MLKFTASRIMRSRLQGNRRELPHNNGRAGQREEAARGARHTGDTRHGRSIHAGGVAVRGAFVYPRVCVLRLATSRIITEPFRII